MAKKQEVKETQTAVATVTESKEMAELSSKMLDSSSSFDSRDLIIPKILMMQGLSKAVADSKAVLGELRESLNNKLLAAVDKKIEVIFFFMNKNWIHFEKEKEKFVFTGVEPWTPENKDMKWEETIDGKSVRNDQSMDYYCLLPSEIKEGVFMPYVVSFRRTSYKTGKRLFTNTEMLKVAKRPLASKVFLLSCTKTKNDLGTFYVYDVEMSRDATGDEIKAVAPWYDLVQTTRLKVDDSDLQGETHDTGTVDADFKV